VRNACSNLLDDYEAFSLMDENRRKRYLKDIYDTWPLTHDACEQLRMALLLSQPDQSDRDRQKALKLLRELLGQEKLLDPHAYQLARLLHDQLSKTRTEQLKALELRHRLKAQRSASRQLSEQLNNLQSQLQQLKNIEQNINEKEQSIITPSTSNIPAESP
jgi:tRNA/tmRNA/rRNA uracil-C5-methylase (TrmA/RlmC/RlmD family)